MPYQEPDGPRWHDDSVAVIEPDCSQETATRAALTSRPQPTWKRYLKRYLPGHLRMICVLLIGFVALILLLALLLPGLFSLPGQRLAADSSRQSSAQAAAQTPPATSMPATPTLAISPTSEIVYSLTPDGMLRAWNLIGQETLWRRKTHALPNHALLNGNYALFSLVWNSDHSWLEAWRASDGQPLWERDLPGEPGPEPLLFRGENLYVNAQNGTLLALQALTGNRLWSFKTGMVRPLSEFFFASGHVAAVLSRNGAVSVVRTSDGEQIYQYHNDLSRLFPLPQTGHDIVYLQPSDTVQAVRVSNGMPLWFVQHEGNAHLLPLVVDANVVYMSQDDGVLEALNGNDGSKLWEYHAASGLFSEPVVRAGMLYLVRKDGALIALRASDGSVLWQTSAGRVQGQIMATDHSVYFNIDLPGQTIYALQADDGHELWHHAITTDQASHWIPLIVNDLLLFGPDDFSLQAWDGSSGQYLWQYRAPIQILWEPAIDGSYLYLTRADSGVDVLQSDTGARLWQYTYSGEEA